MSTEYMAFWRYDQYPYCLYGTVVEMVSNGCVRVQEYGGQWFTPFAIVPKKVGEIKARNLDDLHNAYARELEQIQQKYRDSAKNMIANIIDTYGNEVVDD